MLQLAESPELTNLVRYFWAAATIHNEQWEKSLNLTHNLPGNIGLRLQANAVLHSGDAVRAAELFLDWARNSEGPERAYALTRVIDLSIQSGLTDQLDELLRHASLADGDYGAVCVLREIINRQQQADSLKSEDWESDKLLVAAAQACKSGDFMLERDLLRKASRDDSFLVSAQTLLHDNIASTGTLDEVRTDLLAIIDQRKDSLGIYLVLAELAARTGNVGEAFSLLQRAREIVPSDPVVLRPLGRLEATNVCRKSCRCLAGGVPCRYRIPGGVCCDDSSTSP